MRKITLLMIVCLSAFMFSCKDELELTPFDKVDEEMAFKTTKDFTAALRGTYSRLIGVDPSFYMQRKMILSDVLSDNLIINQTGRKSLMSYYEFKLAANSTWGGLLLYGYSVIDRSNRIISNINNLPDGDFKNDVLAQAKALRAMAHLDIVMTYAPSYTAVDGDAANSGIPIKDDVDASAKPARNTLNETFNFIISELKSAKDLAANDRASVASGFLNKSAIGGLIARAYLYKGDYPAAKAAAQETADLIGSADLAIGSRANFTGIWKDNSPGNAGVLFKIVIAEQDRIQPGTEFSQTTSSGTRSEYVPTFELYSKYDDTDIRKSAYFSTSNFSGFTYNHIIKYSSRPGASANVVDIKVLRGAEVYLVLAEAAFRSGDETTALDALDEVRSRRYDNFVSDEETGQSLLNAILLERRLELAFEGQRFYDLKRLGLPIVRSATEGELADGTGTPAPSTAQIIPANDFKFTLPIPTAERQANPNFAQSPNY
ncbi:MAG TPA: RagB/SusD family nutrient uptake outer membrane protein [Chitinophagales bacterium]|nr:RagB/SusD family nutrient uptake outer membrane protein [Chitinophagales bacterium]